MTAFLHRLPIAHKFWLILALPLLALAWFAISGALDRQRLAANLDDLVRLTTVSRQAGDLIHAVQLERGLTAGYLGSEGQRFGDRLETQRPETDARHAAFEASLAGLDTQGLAPRLRRHVDKLDRLIADTPDLRRRVDGLTIAVEEAVARYTALNDELMGMVGRLAHAAADPDIARTLGAYASLLQAKDLAGIERAWLANAFAADGMAAPAYRQLLTLLGRQAAFLQAFHTQADNDLNTRLDQALDGPQVSHLEALRRRVMQRGTDGGYGIDPQEWFDGQTGKIEALKAVEDTVAARVLAGAEDLRKAANREFWQYLAIALLSALLALGLSRLIVRSILAPLDANLTAIRERGGDLTRRLAVPGHDELSRLYQAFNEATEETARLVGHIRRSALSVEVAGGEIAQGNQELAQRTEEQSASQVETASSLDQITAAVRQTADHAHQADDMTQDVAEQADEARRVAVEAGDAMRRIQTANREVTRIIGAIDSIAFQTNLLALNASVEAARAGEHGRGFAVVASEVRKLASRSAEEAAQIRRRIDTNVEHIDTGQALVDATGQDLETIARRVRDLASLVGEMSATTQEQAAGVTQINQAMSQLEDVTQQNAGLVEQVAAASRALDEQAGEMTTLIGRFRVPEAVRTPPALVPATLPHDGPFLQA